jgi:UDP-N-acetylmuramate dehydrogenase
MAFSNVKGRIKENQALSAVTWFQVGGPCDIFFKPFDTDDLSLFLKTLPIEMPRHIIGAGSNILIDDTGVDGCVIKLGGAFASIENHDNLIICGAAALDRTVAMTAKDYGLSNLEFLVGIPGTIGGAIAMNAGAYGSEIKDHLQWVELMSPDGTVFKIDAGDLTMTYRHGNLPKGAIVLKAAFNMNRKPVENIAETLNAYLQKREETQPVRGKTGGSTFKNPTPHAAWKLIDDAGCRGLMIGGAQVSEKHCNFLLNLGNATAKDIEALGETVRQKVFQTSGIDLEWEIIRLKRHA